MVCGVDERRIVFWNRGWLSGDHAAHTQLGFEDVA